jgi:hypothetical protein
MSAALDMVIDAETTLVPRRTRINGQRLHQMPPASGRTILPLFHAASWRIMPLRPCAFFPSRISRFVDAFYACNHYVRIGQISEVSAGPRRLCSLHRSIAVGTWVLAGSPRPAIAIVQLLETGSCFRDSDQQRLDLPREGQAAFGRLGCERDENVVVAQIRVSSVRSAARSSHG